MGYEDWSLDSLWSEYNRLKKKQSTCDSKKKRLEKAYNALKAPKKEVNSRTSFSFKPVVESVAGDWKGDLKEKEFDRDMETLQSNLKRTYKRMDEYHDSIQTEINKASKESGSYIPIISDIYRGIKKLTN